MLQAVRRAPLASLQEPSFFVHICTLLSLFVAGENCNRGAALGALLGAGGSYREAFIPQEWKDELRDAQEILPDILKDMQ